MSSNKLLVSLSLAQAEYLRDLVDDDLETQDDLDEDELVTARAARRRLDDRIIKCAARRLAKRVDA